MHDTNQDMIGGRSIDDRLRDTWRRQRRFAMARGLCHALICLFMLVAVSFLLDWSLILPPLGRKLLVVANALVLLAVFYASWWRRLRAFDPARVAIQLEGLYPQFHSGLVSHVQLRGREHGPEGASAGLIGAVSRDAAETARRLDFRGIVHFADLKWPTIYCLALLALLAGSGIAKPEVAKVFLARMFAPSSRLRYPTRTSLQAITADCCIQDGETLSLGVRAGGEVPEEGTLTIWPAEGYAETIRVTAGRKEGSGTRPFTHSMDAVYRNFTYAFRVGDAVSDTYSVKVVSTPNVRPQVTIKYPAYTRRPVETAEGLNAKALEGSQVEWRVEAIDRPLKRAEIIPDGGGKPVPMDVAPGGRTATYKMTAQKSFTFGVRWTDLDHGFIYAPAARYSFQVEQDQPPQVVLTTPAQDGKATTQKRLEISFRAKDDYGLAGARIVFAVENHDAAGKDQYLTIPTFKDCPLEVTAEKYRWKILESIPGLAPGDVVRYAVEVLDNRPGTPGIARSESRRLEILSTEEYARLILEERNRLLSRLNQVYDEERHAASAVEKLKTD